MTTKLQITTPIAIDDQTLLKLGVSPYQRPGAQPVTVQTVSDDRRDLLVRAERFRLFDAARDWLAENGYSEDELLAVYTRIADNACSIVSVLTFRTASLALLFKLSL